MKQTIAVVLALGLVGAVGCDSGETKKAEPKAEPTKTDGKDVATPPDPKPEPAKPEPEPVKPPDPVAPPT
mgnify:CR=1 FL=1